MEINKNPLSFSAFIDIFLKELNKQFHPPFSLYEFQPIKMELKKVLEKQDSRPFILNFIFHNDTKAFKEAILKSQKLDASQIIKICRKYEIQATEEVKKNLLDEKNGFLERIKGILTQALVKEKKDRLALEMFEAYSDGTLKTFDSRGLLLPKNVQGQYHVRNEVISFFLFKLKVIRAAG